MEAKAVSQAPRRLSAWPVDSSSPPGGATDNGEQGCEPTSRQSFEHKAVRFTLEEDTVVNLDCVNSKSQSSSSGWQDEPFPAALRERKSKTAGGEPPPGDLAQQLGPQLGSQVCHVVRMVLAEETSKFTAQLSSLRKELAVALAAGRREQIRASRAARAERREQGEDKVSRESFDSIISSPSEMSDPSEGEGEGSGHNVRQTCSAGHLDPGSRTGHGHAGQVATCPDLITLEEDASVGSPRDPETDGRARTASTAAETPQGQSSTQVMLLASHFCSETSSCVGKNAKLQALMRLPTEQEEKERRSSLAQDKMRHPAQVETMGSLADFLPKRSIKERRQLRPPEGEASEGISPRARGAAVAAASAEDYVSAKTTTSSVGGAERAERAHMIGVKATRTNNDTWAKRTKGTRDLQKLEKSLASELFAAKDLVSAPKSSKPKPRSTSKTPLASRYGAMLRRKSAQEDTSRNFSSLKQPSPTQKDGPTAGTVSDSSSPKGDATAIQTDEDKPELEEEALRGDESIALTHPSTSSTENPAELRRPRASMSQTKTLPTISALRQKHEEEITKDLQQAELPSERSEQQNPTFEKAVKVVLALPKACGVLPWGGRWRIASAVYQHAIALVAAGSVAVCARNVVDESREQRDGEMPLSPCVDLILAIGSFAALLACMALCKRKALADAMKLIVNSARREGFVTQWQRESCRDGCCNLVLWLLAVSLRAWYNIDGRLAAFAFSALLQTGMACLIMHCCRCLMKLIDNFCCGVVETPNYVEAMTEWNLFQALCRTACGSLQFCFIAIQGTATAVVLLAIAEVQRGISGFLEMMPGLFVALMVTQISLRAAAVTDKCARVPMLVNSVSAACDLDRDRMYVVEYIVHSQAGFYIFEVRLTSATVLKACYVACAVAFGLASQLL